MNLESSTFSVLVSFIVAILVSIAFYFKDKKLVETAGWLKFILTLCRFFVVLFVVFLLFKPLVSSEKEEVRESIFPVLIDNTKSIKFSDSSLVKDVDLFIKDLKKSLPSANLQVIPFSNELKIGDSLRFEDQGTNLSFSISQLKNLFPFSNVGSALIISDGILTEGSKAINLDQVPLYTIGLGDTTKHPDAFVKNVFHNDISFIGNEFEVEVNLNLKELKGEEQQVKLFFDGKEIAKQKFKVSSSNEFQKMFFKVRAEKPGEIPLKIVIQNAVQEKNKSNNSKTSFITIKEKKLNLLLVHSAPHPDIRLIKSAFFGVEHINLNTTSFKDLDYNLSSTSLVFFIGASSVVQQNKWLDKVSDQKIGFIWLTGASGDFNNQFFSLNKLDNAYDDVTSELNNEFTKFKLSESIKNSFSEALPISVPFGKWNIKGESEVMAYQNVNGIKTDLPLISFSQKQGLQYCLMFGEGYWRLGLKNKNGMIDFLRKSVDAVAVKVDDSKFQIISSKEFFESEDVIVNAKFWNQTGELDNMGDVSTTLSLGDSIIGKYKFLKSQNSFRLNLGKLKEGVYKMRSTMKKGQVLLSKNTSFIVKALKIESEDLVANHTLLKNIAKNNNGEFLLWKNRDNLIQELKSSKNFKSISYFESISDLLIKHKWILYLIIGFISIEWFIRKWQGTI